MKLGFTGHRPQKIPGYDQARLLDLAKAVMVRYQPSMIVCGMALGWDLAVAQAAQATNLPLKAVIPFKGQDSLWQKEDRSVYRSLLEYAERTGGILDVNDWYLERNRQLVQQSDMIIALYDGSCEHSSGTGFTVNYANQQGVRVVNVWDSWMKYAKKSDINSTGVKGN